MSGLFGVISDNDCVKDLFYGTDYHSHLGTQKAGLAVWNKKLRRSIHKLGGVQFKSKFAAEVSEWQGNMGIGVISDLESQPVIVYSRFGLLALVGTGLVTNKKQLVEKMVLKGESFSEFSGGEVNTLELAGKIILGEKNFKKGLEKLFAEIKGSLSLLILTSKGIYAVRDINGRSTLALGQKKGSLAVASESCAFPNLGFTFTSELKPGEVIFLDKNGIQKITQFKNEQKYCAFSWIYTGYPASTYNGVSVEEVRERSGANLAKKDLKEGLKADLVAGIPDSGVAYAIGYAQEAKIPLRRALMKYTPGYGRSFLPLSKEERDQIAQKKLLPVPALIAGKKIVICDDSIVRGTQLRNQVIDRLWEYGAAEIHLRIGCPPLLFACPYFLSTRTTTELAARRAITEAHLSSKPTSAFIKESPSYRRMVERIAQSLGVTSLVYQSIDEMAEAICLPAESLCLYCWQGEKDKK